MFPLWDVRSARWARAWGLPHWQGEYYRCLLLVVVLPISSDAERTQFLWIHMREYHRIWALATGMQCLDASQLRSVSASYPGVMAFMEKEEDCIISCSKNEMCSFYKVKSTQVWWIFLQSANFLVVAFTTHCKCWTCLKQENMNIHGEVSCSSIAKLYFLTSAKFLCSITAPRMKRCRWCATTSAPVYQSSSKGLNSHPPPW